MASIIRQPRSRYWIAAFRDANGKQHRRSTREAQKTRALEVAKQFERVAKGQGHPTRVRSVFAEFYREQYGSELPLATAGAYCEKWLALKKVETGFGTYSRYKEAVEKFLTFLGSSAQNDLAEVTKTQITDFRDLCLKHYAPGSVNLTLSIIKMVFRAARLEGYLWEDPAEGVKRVKNRDTLQRRAFSIDELRAILAVADSEWQSLIRFGLYTGQRLADLATLTWAQIDLERDEIRLTIRKTGKSILIPIAQPLRQHLLAQSSSDNPQSPVHPRSFGIVRAQEGRVSTLSNQFGQLLVAAGLRAAPQRKGTGRSGRRARMDTSFHSLRHTSVSLLKDAGIPDAVVMALVGHESAAMSHRYTHVGIESLEKAAAALPEL